MVKLKSKKISRSRRSQRICEKEGYINKLSNERFKVFRKWQTRWFSLESGQLLYFKDPTDQEPLRTLDLRECRLCEIDVESDKPNAFRVLFSWRTFYLFCTTVDEMNEWVGAIQNMIKKSK